MGCDSCTTLNTTSAQPQTLLVHNPKAYWGGAHTWVPSHCALRLYISCAKVVGSNSVIIIIYLSITMYGNASGNNYNLFASYYGN
jgi:hypothetical protein